MSTTQKTWSTVIDVALQRNPYEGTYEFVVYNADESSAGTFDVVAVTEHAALMEITAWVKGQGWDPTARWNNDNIRRFRKVGK
jgi:hypothetical protein